MMRLLILLLLATLFACNEDYNVQIIEPPISGPTITIPTSDANETRKEPNMISSITADGRSSTSYVFVGDSILLGQGLSDPGGRSSSAFLLARALGLAFNKDVFCRNVTSLGTMDLPDVGYLHQQGKRNVIVLMAGINDIVSDLDPSDVRDRILAWAAKMKAKGFIVYICTLTVINDNDWNAQAVALDELLREAVDPNLLIDVAENPNIGSSASLPNDYIISGEVHLTDLGEREITKEILGAVGPKDLPMIPEMTFYGRDWLSITPTSRSIGKIHSLNARSSNLLNYFEQSAGGSNVEKVDDVINKESVVRFPSSANHFVSFLESSDLHTSKSAFIQILFKASAISSNEESPEHNEQVYANVQSSLGLALKNPSEGIYKLIGYGYDGAFQSVETDIELDVWYLASLRLHEGKIGLQLGQGDWQEANCGELSSVAGAALLGTFDGTHIFQGDMIPPVIYREFTEQAARDGYAMFASRYKLLF